MVYKSADEILKPDKRFENLCVPAGNHFRFMTLADHHAMIDEIVLAGGAPAPVREAYDRARNAMLYAFFDYDLLVVGEGQALSAFELALKYRLDGGEQGGRGTLRNLVDRARKAGIIPRPVKGGSPFDDPVERMIYLRNDLAHGNSQIHSPSMALTILAMCAEGIDGVFAGGDFNAAEAASELPTKEAEV
ncbi:PI-PLC domain-containing protein [Caulobacter hibisci]|uniref:Apea-like HEPN domain-containing protein n=1 Tax=Caulobacter hibisci TaxID=2035993 RepID=A0ABS0T5J8_9CAUL|nr:hypothetical protein [Caulobacter hibisci]MBI1687051.1 hypothetical protein [Caulobacter hibisci]